MTVLRPIRKTGKTLKFQVNKDVLNDAVSFAVRLLAQRPTQAIYGGIRIDADANALQFSVFDYEVSARIEIVAKVDEPGSILVSGRMLSEIANKLPNAPVQFENNGTKVEVSCGGSKFSLATMDVNKFPVLPEIPSITGTISADDFATAVQQVAVAAAKDNPTPAITGVFIQADKAQFSLSATDRYRIAQQDIAWVADIDEEATALVPAKTLLEVAKTFGNQGDVSISIAKNNEREMIAFKAKNRSVTAQLLKGNFPSVRQLFPTDVEQFAIVSTQDLLDSTRRVGLVLESRESSIGYTFKEGELVLDGFGHETTASESVSIELTGDEVSVALRPALLIDGLVGINTEYVKIGFTKSANPGKPGPILLTNHGAKEKTVNDGYRYLLQPYPQIAKRSE